jgi:hypothetical protein
MWGKFIGVLVRVEIFLGETEGPFLGAAEPPAILEGGGLSVHAATAWASSKVA